MANIQIIHIRKIELYSRIISLLSSFEVQERPSTIWPNICPSTPAAVLAWHSVETSGITKLLASNTDDLIQSQSLTAYGKQNSFNTNSWTWHAKPMGKEYKELKEKKSHCVAHIWDLIPEHSRTDSNLYNYLRLKFQPKNELSQS